jgi:hypothetical protein
MLFAYFTPWLNRFHELGVNRDLNFYINELPFHYFNRRATDHIKGEILRIMFGLYDPIAGKAAEPPRLGAGDFVITRPGAKSHPGLRLIACRKILNRITLEGCLRLYLGYSGRWAGKVFHFLPGDPRLILEAMMKGLVEQNGIDRADLFEALRAYTRTIGRSGESAGEWSPVSMIRKVLALEGR